MSEPKEMFQIKIIWGYEIEPNTYTFRTQEELEGFRLGIAVACDWSNSQPGIFSYRIVGEDD